jgi:hypothetical protein
MSGLSSIWAPLPGGHFHLPILVGSGGLAKSRSVRWADLFAKSTSTRDGASMIAAPVAMVQTKTATGSTDKLAGQRSTLVAHRLSHAVVESAHRLQRTIGNQATSRLLAQWASSLTGNEPGEHHEQEADRLRMRAGEAAPGVSWDFANIPVSPPVRPNGFQSRFSLTAPTLRDSTIQPKLAVGRVDDPLEHEADRIADQVVQMPAPDRSIAAAPAQLSRKCAACEEEEQTLQSKRDESSEVTAGEAPSIIDEVLRSPGAPLDRPTRSFMEPRFNHDFSRVRVHTDARGAQSAHAVGAHAYTVGPHIVFAEGRFVPSSSAGRWLLAHELCHVVQQSHATHLQRQETSDASTMPQAAGAPESSMADELLALADQAESARFGAVDPAASAQIAGFVERLRAVAHSDDANEQMRVLAAFTTPQLTRIDQEALRIKSAGQGTAIQRSSASPRIGEPADTAEIEASRLADQVASGGCVTVRQVAAPALQRQWAEAALGALGTFEAAGGAEAELVTGPPGWVVGGLVLLAIGGLTILTMARARAGTCSCQHRDVFTSGGRSCLDLRTSGVCTGPYTGVGTDTASCQANARASAPAACQGCLGHCLFRPG